MGISSAETPFEVGIIVFIVQVMKVSAEGNLPRGVQLATYLDGSVPRTWALTHSASQCGNSSLFSKYFIIIF